MQRYNIFQALLMSFYSKNLYRDVAQNWNGKTFLYLLLLVALAWIPLIIQVQIGVNVLARVGLEKLSQQVPILTFKDGKMSTPENRPYIIKGDKDETVAVIDTSGKYKTLEEAKAPILVTETEMISQSKPDETKITKIPPTVNMVVNPKVVHSYIEKYASFLWLFLFPILVIIGYIYRVIQAFLYGILGIIISGIGRAHLGFMQVVQIAMVAITPAMILSVIVDFFGISIGYPLTIYFIITLIYLIYGIFANKSKDVSIT